MMSYLKLLSRYMELPIESARRAWISRVRLEKQALAGLEAELVADGFEIVPSSGHLTDDGREAHQVGGKCYALRADVHAKILAAMFEHAHQSREVGTKSVVGTESLSAMVCPKCGDSLQHTAVCPKCAAGKLGYRHRYTCVCGGVDMVSKDKL